MVPIRTTKRNQKDEKGIVNLGYIRTEKTSRVESHFEKNGGKELEDNRIDHGT